MEENVKPASFSDILKHKGFLNLWINQILVQVAYNSLNFALLFWVFRLTESNFFLAILLVVTYLPAVIFGLFAGVVVDVTDRKKIIMFINFFLAICMLSLIFLKDSYPAILVITFFINTLAQFYVPAESSAIPLLVKKEQLLPANSLFSITLFGSFLVGSTLAGPIIGFLGINSLFIFAGTLLLIALILSFTFPSIVSETDQRGKRLIEALRLINITKIKEIAVIQIRQTLTLIRGKIPVLVSLLILASVQVVIGLLAALIPSFFERTLHIEATDAAYILIAPLGIGMILGGILVGKIGHFFSRRRIVTTGIIIAGLLFFVVGAAPLISPAISYFPKARPLPFTTQLPISTILTVGSFLLGMAMVSIVVPSQTVLQENTSEKDRGKVFAVLGVLMSALTLIPILLVGVLSDYFGSMPIFIALGGTIFLLGLLGIKPDFYFHKKDLPLRLRRFLGLGHWKNE